MNDLSGQSFGRYHLIEKLGEGGMAVVYKAFDTRLECDVAVKIIRTDQLAPAVLERALKRFEREAKAVAQLTHPNVVKVSDYGEEDGLPYLVMPYLAGGTLKKYLGKLMPYADAARILMPVSKALQYAHDHNIIHRDVKPSNILITESGEPMLTDFGIAKILDLQDAQTLTGTGVGIGTPEYMAPEQWTGEITPAVDIYSLGVVLYELVTGHKPYTADTPAAVLIKTINDPLPRPGTYVEELPGEVENVIFKAMAKKAKDRYASMAEFAAALNLLAREERAAAPTSPIAVVTPPLEEPDLYTSDELETEEATSTNETKMEEKTTVPPTLDQEEPPILKPELPPSFEEPVMVTGKQAGIIIGAIIGVVALFVLIVGGANGWFFAKATPAPTVAPVATEAPVYATEAPIYTTDIVSASPNLQDYLHIEQALAYYPLNLSGQDVTGNNADISLINAPFFNGGVYCNGVYQYSDNPNYCLMMTPIFSDLDMNNYMISADFMVESIEEMPVFVGGDSSRWIGYYLMPDGSIGIWYLSDQGNYELFSCGGSVNLATWYTATVVYQNGFSHVFLDDQYLCSVNFTSFDGGDKLITTTNYSDGKTFKGYMRNLIIANLQP